MMTNVSHVQEDGDIVQTCEGGTGGGGGGSVSRAYIIRGKLRKIIKFAKSLLGFCAMCYLVTIIPWWHLASEKPSISTLYVVSRHFFVPRHFVDSRHFPLSGTIHLNICLCFTVSR